MSRVTWKPWDLTLSCGHEDRSSADRVTATQEWFCSICEATVTVTKASRQTR